MVLSPYDEVLDFSLDLIRRKYNPQKPNKGLINAMISTNNEKAINLALELIDKNSEPFIKDVSFIKTIINSSNESVHTWIRQNIKEDNLTEAELDEIVDAAIAHMLLEKEVEAKEVMEADQEETTEEGAIKSLPSETLVLIFPQHLKQTEPDKIISLINHELFSVQLFGAKLINLNDRKPEEWPESIIIGLLTSAHAQIREEGMKLFSKLTDEQLQGKADLITSLATSEHADLRQQARPIIARVAPQNKAFAESLLLGLYDALLDDHKDEDLAPDVYATIEEHLMPALPVLEKELDEMLRSDKREVQMLTYHLINDHLDLNTWKVEDVARLGKQEMKKLRVMATSFYTEHVDKIKYEKLEAITILDTDWSETREKSKEFFDTHFTEKEWDPELIITLCDSIRPEIQEYGTQILGQYFKDENGIQYLEALSEHPDPHIQLYTTNYLDRYAFNNMDMLNKLKPYFERILSTINTRRVAKMRAFRFIAKQAQEGEEYAKYVIGILNELIGTIVVRENENYVFLLHELHQKYPSLDIKIETVPLEIR